MKRDTLLQTALLLVSIMALGYCKSEPTFEKELLWGRWELQQGFRDGNPTESLDGLFFEFLEDGQMKTNLPVASGESRYEIQNSQIRQIGSPEEIIYTVQELSDSKLSMSTEMRKVKFSFILQKNTVEQE
jgi:hypothetical protein